MTTPHTAEALALARKLTSEIDEYDYPPLYEAAALIRSQAQEIERMGRQILSDTDVFLRVRGERDILRAENAKLREALEKLARLGNGDCYGNSIGNDIARAALEETK